MSLFSTLKSITNHPLNNQRKISALIRFLNWQFGSRINPFPIIYPFTNKAKLIISKSMAGATGNLYCGLHEYNDMAFLLHFLRKTDLFIDIGANIGSYSILAGAHIEADTLSFEPVPTTFQHLLNNIYINRAGNIIKAHNVALGSKDDTINFTSALDTVNHVAVQDSENTIQVTLTRLDKVLENVNHNRPILMKIDVEGFETEVIKGATDTLANKNVKAIIIELNGSGARYNFDERNIHETLMSIGFLPYAYEPSKKKLLLLENWGPHNTIYIRDLDFVNERLQLAPRVLVQNQEV